MKPAPKPAVKPANLNLSNINRRSSMTGTGPSTPKTTRRPSSTLPITSYMSPKNQMKPEDHINEMPKRRPSFTPAEVEEKRKLAIMVKRRGRS